MIEDVAELLPTEKAKWDDFFMVNALVQTMRSDCTRRQVGCIAVSPQKRIVAAGYNAPPKGEPSAVDRGCYKNCCKEYGAPANQGYDSCNALHAEHNCLSELGTRNHYEYVDLYIAARNGESGRLVDIAPPCIMCSRTIKNYNVRNIFCLQADKSVVWLKPNELKTTA